MLIHIARTWNNEGKGDYKKFNEIVYTLLTLAFALYYPFAILKFGDGNSGIFFPAAIDELIFMGNIFIVGVMLGVIGWAFSAKIRCLRNPGLLKDQNNYEVFCEKFLKEYPERNQFKRKITHILPFAVVGGVVMITSLFRDLLGEMWINYAMFIIICIGLDFAFTFLLQDLIRLYDFSYMPPNAIKMCAAGLTPDELDTFTSTSVMVFGFAPFLFVAFPIFFIELLITAVADAMASIFGLIASNRGEKHIFPRGTEKSIEGYIGGFIFTFLCTVLGALFSNVYGLSNWPLAIILTLALILSVVFVIIDIITSKIKLQDNYLNPLIIGLVSIAYINAVGLPIF